MTDRPSASATIEVAVAPDRAFAAFTAEIDAWWVPGPINYFHADRATGMRIEPGQGGRVLELHGDHPPLVIAEITGWDPPRRLQLRGLVDDTDTEITFSPTTGGTTVRVHQFLRPGGERAFLFWPNVLPWLTPHLDPATKGS